MLKALFILTKFKFLPRRFGHARKRYEKKAEVIFKIHDVTDWQTINTSISINKGNQTIKFAQLTGYNERNIFFQKSCRNETGRLVTDLFLFFKKALCKVKASGQQLSFNIFW